MAMNFHSKKMKFKRELDVITRSQTHTEEGRKAAKVNCLTSSIDFLMQIYSNEIPHHTRLEVYSSVEFYFFWYLDAKPKKRVEIENKEKREKKTVK